MMNKLASLTSVIIATAALLGPAQAAVISGAATGGDAVTTDGGIFINLGFSAPAEVGDDNTQNSNLYAFNEDQNIVIGGPVAVDTCTNAAACGTGFLLAGTTVASHYVYFDPSVTRRMIGSVTFDATILAVMDSTTNLAASDFLANNSVIYNSPGLRGLEAEDSYSVSGATLSLNFRASSPGDYIRVLTAFSPVAASLPGPGAMALLGLGLLGLGAMRRKTD